MKSRFRSAFLVVVAVIGGGLCPAAFAASRAPAWGRDGMVVSPEAHATRAGHAILEAGGNAVDAAVAVAFALGVTEPYHSGIGGGGFLLIRKNDGQVIAIDARETAPAAATADMYVREGVAKDASRFGPLAVGVPGLVAGLAKALEAHGTMGLAQVLAPAIELAEKGFPVGPRHVRMVKIWQRYELDERFPATAAIQLPAKGAPIGVGWRLVQRDLAKTLRTLAKKGPEPFYRGAIAKAIVAELEGRGGILVAEDLASYQPVVRDAVTGHYRGLEVISFPPPSSGGIALIEMLNILEGFDLASMEAGSSEAIHHVTEAMKLAFVDRAEFLGDSDFVDVPVRGLTAKAYAEALRKRVSPERALNLEGPGVPDPTLDGGTTHFSITDSEGNAVAVTQTVNLLFGSGITAAGTGIVLNDEMDDFSVAVNEPNAFGLIDRKGRNAVAPKKRPLSSMTPTIALKDGALRMVTGSPGGPRIITTVLLSMLNVIEWGHDVSEAVSAPRFHHQWVPDKLFVEPEVPKDVRDALSERGHNVVVSERHWSSAQAIVIDPETGWHWGGSDPRSDGLALGLNRP